MKLPFKYTPIKRYELPALERKKCVAQAVMGDFVFLKFHQTYTECLSLNDLPILQLEKRIRKCIPRGDIRDTVIVGCLQKNSVTLIDVLMVENKSLKIKHWPERLEALKLLWMGFSLDGQTNLPLAQQWKFGFMRAFDEVLGQQGKGLLIRIPGKPGAVLCSER